MKFCRAIPVIAKSWSWKKKKKRAVVRGIWGRFCQMKNIRQKRKLGIQLKIEDGNDPLGDRAPAACRGGLKSSRNNLSETPTGRCRAWRGAFDQSTAGIFVFVEVDTGIPISTFNL